MNRTAPRRKDYLYLHAMTTRWRDNDVYAHVNNAVFYEYIDTVVNQWLIDEAGLKVPSSDLIGLVVRSECDFFAPLAFPGQVTGGLAVGRQGRTSVTYDVTLFAGNAEEASAAARFTHVYVDPQSRRPVPLPDWFANALRTLGPTREDGHSE